MKTLISIVLFGIICYQPILADNRSVLGDAVRDNKSEVVDLIKETMDLVFEALRDESLDPIARDEKLISALSPVFDFERMAKNSLGKKYWNRLKKEKQTEFTEAFIIQARNFFIEQLTPFTNETIEFEEAIEVRKKRIHVQALQVSKDNEVKVLYKLYKSWRKPWRVYDLEILGVSMTQTYREQFITLMEEGGIDELLATIKPFDEIQLPSDES